jgi:hypothetical protein
MVDADALITRLGGPAKVARDLGFSLKSGVQRVHNWRTRGIPAGVLLAHAAYFGINQLNTKLNRPGF